MPDANRILFWIAAFCSLLYCVKLCLVMIGHHDGECDGGTDHIDPGFTLFTTQSLLAFGMGFGWLSLALLRDSQLPVAASIALGAANGSAMLLLSAGLMRLLRRLNTPAHNPLPQAGDRARTYTTIPARRQRQGLVQVFDPMTRQARQYSGVTDASQDIPSHVDVVVVAVQHDTVVVRQ